MSELMSYQQFLYDGHNNLHTADYLLTHLSKLSSKYSIVESSSNNLYSLSVFDINNKAECLINIEGTTDERVPFGFFVLDMIYSQSKPKAKLKLLK